MKEIKANRITILLLLAGAFVLFFLMIRSYVTSLLLAGIVSGLIFPLHQRIEKKLNNKDLAAGVSIVVTLMVLLSPLSVIGFIILQQAGDLTSEVGPEIAIVIDNTSEINIGSVVTSLVDTFNGGLDFLNNIVEGLGDWIKKSLSYIYEGSAAFFLSLFIFLFAMYFFLRDGITYVDKLFYLLPLNQNQKNQLISQFKTVSRSAVRGYLLVGLIQGAVGGIGLIIFGVPNALFWAFAISIASITPGLGTSLVWIPCSVYLMLTGESTNGILLALYSTIITSNIDDLIAPRLVGKNAGISPLMILLSILGGITLFGFSGVIIGPILGSLLICLIDIYKDAFDNILDSVNDSN